jgi:hypothetical protein
VTYTGNRNGFYIHGWGTTHGCIAIESGKFADFKNKISQYFQGRATIPLYVSYGATTPTPSPTPTGSSPTPNPTPGLDEECSGCKEGDTCSTTGGGGIAEPIVLGADSAAETSTPDSSRDYTAPIAAAGVAAVLALAAGGWYVRRRFHRKRTSA